MAILIKLDNNLIKQDLGKKSPWMKMLKKVLKILINQHFNNNHHNNNSSNNHKNKKNQKKPLNLNHLNPMIQIPSKLQQSKGPLNLINLMQILHNNNKNKLLKPLVAFQVK